MNHQLFLTARLRNTVQIGFASFSFIVLAALSSEANANTYKTIDRIANRIQNQANQVVNETSHYVHTPQYHHLRNDALAVAALAEHIHDLAHHQGSVRHLVTDLTQLDARFRNLKSLLRDVEVNAAYGHGHLHGSTKRAHRILDRIEDDIHKLRKEIASLPVVVHRPVFVNPAPACQPPHFQGGHGWSGANRGITIGGVNSQLTFRF